MFKIPSSMKWRRVNPVLVYRGAEGAYDEKGLSDPCVVWDQAEGKWVMYYSAVGCFGPITAIAANPSNLASYFEQWIKGMPLPLTNREILPGDQSYQKWWVLMDVWLHNKAVKMGEDFWAFFASAGEIRMAKAQALAGPWTIDPQPVLKEPGQWLDSPSAYWFPQEKQGVLYYTAGSGKELLAATIYEDGRVEKAGLILAPTGQAGHWAEARIGGLDLFPGEPEPWLALVEAGSPRGTVTGWATCDQAMPLSGWRLLDPVSPLEWPDQLPPEALETGQEAGLGRHHLFCLPDGRRKMYYSSGKPGFEQIYYRVGV